jgi:hypothetical protein
MGGDFSSDTTGAPFSVGNPTTLCGPGASRCINGCRSDFYRVTGGFGGIQATTCGDAAATSFNSKIYVWEGNSTDCSTFSCVNGA